MSAKLLTVAQVAEVLGVHEKTIRDAYIPSGDLPAINIASGTRAKRWRIEEKDLDQFIESRRTAPITPHQRRLRAV
jgi:excisionase family DNA binding protein